MLSIEKCSVPPNSLLAKYSLDGFYTDSYRTELPGHISLSEFVFAFYTSWLFKVEQFILTHIVHRPSSDGQARELADGKRTKFAAWSVEDRNENELLMCDMLGRTRSWFMVTHTGTPGNARTQLYFGSAVVPRKDPKTGKLSLGLIYRTLLGFHKIYSVLLVYFARRNLAH
jgi:hypothetical protein